MFSDEEKKKLTDVLEEIRDEQREQNERLDDIEKILKGDSEYPTEPGMRQKVNEMYQILTDARALKKFFLGGLFLVGAVFGGTLWDFITRLFGAGP